MRQTPFDIGTVHFVGIGGIGMSGIAEVMHNLGYTVQGSDQAVNANVERLQSKGINIFTGQKAQNVAKACVVVISSAIKEDNPEIVAAREKGLPLVRRAEMLAELMRLKWCISVAGTHGKTTTTSMVGAVLDRGGVDPTIINGGIINQYGTNARLGSSDWMVVEADESDGTFVKLPATIAIVTNMDPEHLDFYGTFEKERQAFKSFLDRVPFYGAAILCIDHPEVQSLIPDLRDRRVITYGLSPLADVQAININSEEGVTCFDVRVRKAGKDHVIENVSLPMPGNHNIQNALAAIAAGREMRLDDQAIRTSFQSFKGVKRRFSRVGKVKGVVLIDDYAHHPVEIAATLLAARETFKGRITAIFQPHRYSRFSQLWEDFCTAFNDADRVLVAPVFAAGEDPLDGVDPENFVTALKSHGHRRAQNIDSAKHAIILLANDLREGDAIIYLGAGSITHWAGAAEKDFHQALRGGARL